MEHNNQNTKNEVWESYKSVLTEELMGLLEKAEDIGTFTRNYNDCFKDVSFVGFLENLMEKKGLKKSEVIKASGLNESFAYQIFSGYKNPSRDKLLALAIGMRLTIEECQRFLKLAGANELYVKNRRDSIVMFGIRKGLSVIQINDILFDMEEFVL